MIVFDLKCAHEHVFEAWFGSSAAFEDQRARRLVACPICGDTAITKAIMAPNIAAKGNSRPSPMPSPAAAKMPAGPITPETVKAALQALAAVQAKALETSQWVGRSFADRARAMHAGEEEPVQIHGQSTLAEAQALVEDGVSVLPLLVPIVPPEALN